MQDLMGLLARYSNDKGYGAVQLRGHSALEDLAVKPLIYGKAEEIAV